jgi:hypothetical protein
MPRSPRNVADFSNRGLLLSYRGVKFREKNPAG